MSVYRKTENGITGNKAIVDTFHQKRVELAVFLNQYHEYKYSEKAEEVIEYHRRHLKRTAPGFIGYIKKALKKILKRK